MFKPAYSLQCTWAFGKLANFLPFSSQMFCSSHVIFHTSRTAAVHSVCNKVTGRLFEF
jgi:hypothetical protein